MRDERRINVRVEDEEFQTFRRKAFEDRTTFQDVLITHLREWVSTTKGVGQKEGANKGEKDVISYNPDTAEYHLMLETILTSGHEIASDTMTRILIAFRMLVRDHHKGDHVAGLTLPALPAAFADAIAEIRRDEEGRGKRSRTSHNAPRRRSDSRTGVA